MIHERIRQTAMYPASMMNASPMYGVNVVNVVVGEPAGALNTTACCGYVFNASALIAVAA